MAKIGNYVQRDFHKRYRFGGKKTWSDYNKVWNKRRAVSAERVQQLNSIAHRFSTIATVATQANALFVMQNQGKLGTYASQAAALSRLDIRV